MFFFFILSKNDLYKAQSDISTRISEEFSVKRLYFGFLLNVPHCPSLTINCFSIKETWKKDMSRAKKKKSCPDNLFQGWNLIGVKPITFLLTSFYKPEWYNHFSSTSKLKKCKRFFFFFTVTQLLQHNCAFQSVPHV